MNLYAVAFREAWQRGGVWCYSGGAHLSRQDAIKAFGLCKENWIEERKRGIVKTVKVPLPELNDGLV